MPKAMIVVELAGVKFITYSRTMKIFTSLLITFSFHFVFAQNCLQNRGSLDIGSGTTKGLIAEVDICEKKIIKVIFEDRLPLSFNEALEKSSQKIIPDNTVNEAIPQMRSLVAKMQEFKPTSIKAVATSVFRVANNGQNVAKNISTALQIPVTVITQEQEAELGYLSALAVSNAFVNNKTLPSASNIIVWDIGGGSMQMYAVKNGTHHVYKGDLASVTFKNKVLQVLQFKDPKTSSSPNPLGKNREAALQLAKNHAYLNVPEYFKKTAPEALWIGVGGVLSSSVQNQTVKAKAEFSQEELNQVLITGSQLNDSQIQSEYRITDITNLALVLGYMQALKIQKIETVKASLGQGLLLKELTLADIKARSKAK